MKLENKKSTKNYFDPQRYFINYVNKKIYVNKRLGCFLFEQFINNCRLLNGCKYVQLRVINKKKANKDYDA